MTKDELRSKANTLPLSPGIYMMIDKTGKVIYVGKAKRLKNRVSQYFQDSASHTEKTRRMVEQVDRFDVIIVSNELEALVLENSLIKRHSPHYNILLKDDKGYPFIRLSREEYPRFSLSNRFNEDGARYFGPFGGRAESRAALDALLAAFRLPNCTRRFPQAVGAARPCLSYHIGLCDGFCLPEMSAEEYRRRIEQAVRVLEGKARELMESMIPVMKAEAEAKNFEKAAQIRDRIYALGILGQKQKVIAGLSADTDIWGIYFGEGKSCYAILHMENGNLTSRETETFLTPLEQTEQEVLAAAASQYYLTRTVLPREILLPFSPAYKPSVSGENSENSGRNPDNSAQNAENSGQNVKDSTQIPENPEDSSGTYPMDGESLCDALTEALTHRAERKVWVHMPQRGEKAALCELARQNAVQEAERVVTDSDRAAYTLKMLAKMLGLSAPPGRMESYDISNTGKSDIVASMVVYQGTAPLKSAYRRFHIKELDGAPDDYASMREVVRRRVQRAVDKDEKFLPLPDIFLIDGGQTHARAALEILTQFDLKIPVFGMVKDRRHRTRALMTPEGKEIGIAQNQAVFSLIGRIQEETHRYAVRFHHQSHNKNAVHSELDDIPGVGPKRRQALWDKFGTVQAIREADPDTLSTVIPYKTALAVWKYFHPHEGDKKQS